MKEYQDFYFKKARAENYPARSVYKLKEMDAKFGLLSRGMRTLDLGAAPGSWTLACSEKIGGSGKILACDLKEITTALPENVTFLRTDIFSQSAEFVASLTAIGPFDLALSDMAPATTGDKFTDQARSYNLAVAAFELACQHLKPGGHFVVKIFMGPDSQNLAQDMRQYFERVKSFKPKSSRPESKETFFVGLGFKSGGATAANSHS